MTAELTAAPQLDAERATLGALLTGTVTLDQTPYLTPDLFAEPRHAQIFTAIRACHLSGRPVDAITVHNQLQDVGIAQRVGGAPYLFQLLETCPLAASLPYYAEQVRNDAQRRAIRELGVRLGQIANSGDVDDALQLAHEHLEKARGLLTTGTPVDDQGDVEELDEFLDGDDPDYEWIVPGLLERGDRVILTGGEGHGKSTLMRQIAVQTSAGVHPFTGDTIEPLTVLYVDLENSKRQSRRKLRPLRIAAGLGYQGRLHVAVRTKGLDLAGNAEDRDWLTSRIEKRRPDLLITGPIYKMANGDPTEEAPAKAVALYLDQLRETYGCAVLLEAHSAKKGGQQKHRPSEPYGASLWMRWPEFGIHINGDTGQLGHWRGQRDERDWPTHLGRGGEWPWTPKAAPAEKDEGTPRFGMSESEYNVLQLLCDTAGQEYTRREIQGALQLRGHPLEERAVQTACRRLTERGLIAYSVIDNRGSRAYRAEPPGGPASTLEEDPWTEPRSTPHDPA